MKRRELIGLLASIPVFKSIDLQGWWGSQSADLPIPRKRKSTNLNKKLNFKNFIVVSSNQHAHAVAQATATASVMGTVCHNPLVLGSTPGMGKTHLLNAIGNYAARTIPVERIQLITGDQYLNEFISSIRRGETREFRKRFRDQCSLLLIDDFQMIARGEVTQEEFLCNLKELISQGKQVVITTDRAISSIKGLNSGVVDLIQGGVVEHIDRPNYLPMKKIATAKAKKMKLTLSEKELSRMCQEGRSVRSVEGVLNKLKINQELKV